MNIHPTVESIARDVADAFGRFSEVEAVVLAGSQTDNLADQLSDIDLYIYARDALVALQRRRTLIQERAEHYDLNSKYRGTTDEWIEKSTGIRVDVTYRDVGWIIDEVQRIMVHHHATMGCSTTVWYNVLNSIPYFDRGGWFSELQKTAHQPYPDDLMYAIVKKNHPALRKGLSSYKLQIARALERGDFVTVQHRTAGLLASYFDVLFAVNRMPHPGDKRMLDIAEAHCVKRPPQLREQVTAVLYSDDLLLHIDELVDGLDDLLIAEGMLPHRIR